MKRPGEDLKEAHAYRELILEEIEKLSYIGIATEVNGGENDGDGDANASSSDTDNDCDIRAGYDLIVAIGGGGDAGTHLEDGTALTEGNAADLLTNFVAAGGWVGNASKRRVVVGPDEDLASGKGNTNL